MFDYVYFGDVVIVEDSAVIQNKTNAILVGSDSDSGMIVAVQVIKKGNKDR